MKEFLGDIFDFDNNGHLDDFEKASRDALLIKLMQDEMNKKELDESPDYKSDK